MTQRRFAIALATASLLPAARADVQILDGPNPDGYFRLQDAIDAAQDGDVLLLGPDTYGSATIDGKGLTLMAAPHGPVVIDGTLTVRNTLKGSTTVIGGLTIQGETLHAVGQPALVIENNKGPVRVFDTLLQGGHGEEYDINYGNGGDGVQALDCTQVAFVDCDLIGGNGGYDPTYLHYSCYGGHGGQGLECDSSVVSLYSCSVAGGHGGDCGFQGGDGGDACNILTNFGIYASGTSFDGGHGGDGEDFVWAFGGDGGDGLNVGFSSQAQVLDSSWTGGTPGVAPVFPGNTGSAGVAQGGLGTLNPISGSARRFTWESVVDDTATMNLQVEGEPGDRVFWTQSDRTAYRFNPAVKGVWLVPFPTDLPFMPMGVIPPSGTLTIPVDPPDVQGSNSAWLFHGQGYILDSSDQPFVSSGRPLLVLDRMGLPDCNTNGVLDILDAIEGTVADCDANLRPDACDLDCNSNGVPDTCDINAGTSLDLNQNGIPDECDPLNATWYVDASASPGGNGTSSMPFDTIQAGVDLALAGDTVVLRDGIYSGFGNCDVEFQDRDITVKSENGPFSCSIDCEGLARAFVARKNETLDTCIEGITIRNGDDPNYGDGGAIYVRSDGLTIRNCVFEDCHAVWRGGAVYGSNGSELRVESCTFRRNDAGFPSVGGAEGGAIAAWIPTTIVNCVFEENTADEAGAVWLGGGGSAVVSHCQFLDNSAATHGGGALVNATGELVPGDKVYVDNCLFAGNSAVRGGAMEFLPSVFGSGGAMEITSCTFTANTATQSGGAITVRKNADTILVNSILWANSSPDGNEYHAQDPLNTLAVGNCDIEGGQAAMSLGGSTLFWGTGNIDLDPLFSDPSGSDLDPTTGLDGDYRPLGGSPVLDAGNFARVPDDRGDIDGDGDTTERTPWDLDLSPRIVDDPGAPNTGFGPPWVDMGAYER